MRNLFILMSILTFSACSLYDVNLGNENAAVAPKILTEKIPDMPDFQPDVSVYKLSPGDVIAIKVYLESSMDRELRINGDGTITYPMAGNIQIAGLTVTEAENKISGLLSAYYRNPQVNVVIKNYNNKKIAIYGQVHKPSAMSLPAENKMTLMEAITSAGGFTSIANTSKVRIVRMIEGKQQMLEIDVNQITKNGHKDLDIELMAGDLIYVPETIF